jgi:FKBP-type peptidyl-prolyl cis-trans isomerase
MPSRSVAAPSKTFSKNQLLGILIVALILAIVGGYVLFGRKSYVTTPSGLKYRDQVVGTGDSPTVGREVVVHYTGRLADGTKFDSSLDRNQPFTTRIGVGAVIKGWDEGLMSMRVGGKRQLIIPPELGYGAAGSGTIPPNATLTFDVELLSVK